MILLKSLLPPAVICLAAILPANAARFVVIGDSLSAEYDALPDFPGIENPTEYARVTVEGWESMCWVEILGRLRTSHIDFGRYRADLPGWPDLRFSGYEFNFAIPGFTAANFEDVVNSSFFSNPQYLPHRAALRDAVRNQAEAAIVWLGANEFRSQYGFLYEGGDPAPLIAELLEDLDEVLDFLRDQNAALKIVLVNLPDLGAAPDKRVAHPDPEKRARVTEATRTANRAIEAMAVARGFGLADAFAQTRRLIEGEPVYFGAVEIINAVHPDNDPGFHFTRDGLHPNTPSQLEIARIILDAFNVRFGAGIPQISDREALDFLGINPLQPYLDWVGSFPAGAAGMADDPDGDGWPNLAEFLFGSDPGRPGPWPLRAFVGAREVEWSFRVEPGRTRLVRVWPQSSRDLIQWADLAESEVRMASDGMVTARFMDAAAGFLRLRFSVIALE